MTNSVTVQIPPLSRSEFLRFPNQSSIVMILESKFPDREDPEQVFRCAMSLNDGIGLSKAIADAVEKARAQLN